MAKNNTFISVIALRCFSRPAYFASSRTTWSNQRSIPTTSKYTFPLHFSFLFSYIPNIKYLMCLDWADTRICRHTWLLVVISSYQMLVFRAICLQEEWTKQFWYSMEKPWVGKEVINLYNALLSFYFQNIAAYLSKCSFLPKLNNELPHERNATFKNRLTSLQNLVLIMVSETSTHFYNQSNFVYFSIKVIWKLYWYETDTDTCLISDALVFVSYEYSLNMTLF